jgi:hypothetical protein
MQVINNKRFTLEGEINDFNLAIQSQNTQDSYHHIKKMYLWQNISFSKIVLPFGDFQPKTKLVEKIFCNFPTFGRCTKPILFTILKDTIQNYMGVTFQYHNFDLRLFAVY